MFTLGAYRHSLEHLSIPSSLSKHSSLKQTSLVNSPRCQGELGASSLNRKKAACFSFALPLGKSTVRPVLVRGIHPRTVEKAMVPSTVSLIDKKI